MEIVDDPLVLPKPAENVRAGWAEAARKIAGAGDDTLLIGEFDNEGDDDLAW